MDKQQTGKVAYKIDFAIIYNVTLSFMCKWGDVTVKEKRLSS